MIAGLKTRHCGLWVCLALLLAACDTTPSTGNSYVMNGGGCPDGFTYLQDGATWKGCRFDVSFDMVTEDEDPTPMTLVVTCGRLEAVEVWQHASRPVWRRDSGPGLQVFWPGNCFACAKLREK